MLPRSKGGAGPCPHAGVPPPFFYEFFSCKGLTISLEFIHSFTSFNKHLWGPHSGPGPGWESRDRMSGGLDMTLPSQSVLATEEVGQSDEQGQPPTLSGVAQDPGDPLLS